MITFKKLTLRNFLSYGNNITEINLNNQQTTLIIGENLDDTSNGITSNGVGKAQPLHSLILTPLGWTTFRDIKVGDVVITPNRNVANVIGVYDQGIRPCVEITFQDNRTVQCDLNHLWKVQIDHDQQSSIVDTQRLIELFDQQKTIEVPTISYNDKQHRTRTFSVLRQAVEYQRQCWSNGVQSYLKQDSFANQYVVVCVNQQTVKITSIKQCQSQLTRCIMLDDDDHMYITNNYIATHNTTIVNAITYCIYDKPLSKISKDNLVNNINNKDMEVSIEFETGDNHQYCIKRYRKHKQLSGNGVILLVDGVDKSRGPQTNEDIEKIIGIPYELFIRIVVFSASHTGFLNLPVSHPTSPSQKGLIEELFGLTILTEKSELLKKQIKETQLQLDIANQIIEKTIALEEKNKQLLAQFIKNSQQWEIAQQNKIEKLIVETKQYKHFDFDQEIENQQKINEFDTQLIELINQLSNNKKQTAQLFNQHKKLSNELDHLNDHKCPYCLQQYADSTKQIEINVSQLKTIESDIEQLVEKNAELNLQIAKITQSQQQIIDLVKFENVNSAVAAFNRFTSSDQQLEQLIKETNPHLSSIEQLKTTVDQTIDYDHVNNLTKLSEHQKFMLKLLTRKDSFVRKHLINGNLPVLNQRLLHYTSQLGLPLVVEFNQQMEPTISKFGRQVDYDNLSSGQAARVNFALSFAFKDIREMQSNKINITLLDEVLDHGLDSVGIELAVKMVKSNQQQQQTSVFVITHRSEIMTMFPNVMTIEMKDQFSSIRQ